MKRNAKIIALAMTLILLCTCFTSCSGSLKEMREAHAIYTDDGVITYKGKEFKKLPSLGDLEIATNAKDTVYVTASDVPVLLSEMLGDFFDISLDGNFLIETVMYDREPEVYCIADLYDQVIKELNRGVKLDRYGYEVVIYGDEYDDMEIKNVVLSKGDSNALDSFMTEKNIVTLSGGMVIIFKKSAPIYSCTESGVFKKDAFVIGETEDGHCYIEVCDEKTGEYTYYLVEGSFNKSLIRRIIESAQDVYKVK